MDNTTALAIPEPQPSPAATPLGIVIRTTFESSLKAIVIVVNLFVRMLALAPNVYSGVHGTTMNTSGMIDGQPDDVCWPYQLLTGWALVREALLSREVVCASHGDSIANKKRIRCGLFQ
jgi:hypothetical protein